MKYTDTWDLDSIFPGGTKSAELQAKLKEVEKQINGWQKQINDWNMAIDSSPETLKMLLKNHETIEKGLLQAGTFVQMVHDAFMDDEYANVVMGQVMDLESKVETIFTTFMKVGGHR